MDRAIERLPLSCQGCARCVAAGVMRALCSRMAVPLPARFHAGGLFDSERASTAADPGSRLAMPDDLIDDEPHANGRNEPQGGKRGHLRCDRKEAE